ncbi:hypothetical protein ACGFK1_13170 [Mycobacterium sp. NPDC048908]|uniref:hypothetical protein n=1 Tax=Mycobacterium sp. NPDC048908 TaxID=3364292 RepID=UPI00372236C3
MTGLLAAAVGPVAVVIALGVGLLSLVAWRPVFATYLYLATLPFIAGIERGTLIPLLRPNEALLILLMAAAMAGGYVRALRGAPLQLRLRPLDIPLATFVLLATLWPICSMLLRGVPPGSSDVMAVLPVCKLAGLLLLVRTTVRTPTHVVWCIRLIIGGAVGLAAIAILQTLGVGPVLTVLQNIDPGADFLDQRGSATLTSPIATGDYILIGLTLLIASAVRGLIHRWTRFGAGLVLAAGLLAAGQFSTWLGALVIGALIFWRVPKARVSAVRLAPMFVVAMLLGSPALRGRLEEFSNGGSPQSWRVRWDNLSHFYIPELVENCRFLVGVSPNSVVIPPDTWRDVVYLESGFLQLLWIGGVPLLAAFIVLSWAVLRWTGRLSWRTDGIGACASALAIAWWMIVILLLLDPHLFMRGPGDLLFTLIGLVTGRALEERSNDATS